MILAFRDPEDKKEDLETKAPGVLKDLLDQEVKPVYLDHQEMM